MHESDGQLDAAPTGVEPVAQPKLGGCPDLQLLERFVVGNLVEPELSLIGNHADQCALCQSLLTTLDEKQDELLARLRRCKDASEIETLDKIPAADLAADRVRPVKPLVMDKESTLQIDKLLEKIAHRDATSSDRDWLQWARQTFEDSGADEPIRVGDCVLKEVLGVGGMGIVFAAHAEKLQRSVAIKVMRPEIAKTALARERFAVEARAMAAVVDPHVATILQVGQIGTLPYLVMELLHGESLAQRIRNGPACSVEEVIQIGIQIALGLAAAHRCGLIHRDVKPENVFLVKKTIGSATSKDASATGTSSRQAVATLPTSASDSGSIDYSIKLLDFGLARSMEGTSNPAGAAILDDENWVLGTPAFMSPEQALSQRVDERTDLFSLGCLLFRLLSGRLPFEGATPQELMQARVTQSPVSVRVVAPQVTPELAALIDQMLARDPQRRPTSASDVARRLSALLPRTRGPLLGRRSLIAAGLVAVTGLAYGGWRWWEESQRIEPLDPAWLKRVKSLNAAEQVVAVVTEMRRRNPRWDAEHEWREQHGDVVRFKFESQYVRDILPLQVFAHLQSLYCVDHRQWQTLKDFAPLAGMKLLEVDAGYTGLSDLTVFRDMSLTIMRLKSTGVRYLTPLAKSPLKVLQLAETQVEDLSPLRDCPLELLSFWGTRVRDLTPLSSLSRLNRVECEKTLVSDLNPLRGLPLRHLACQGSPISDYSVLAELPLEELHLTYQPEKHRELLSRIKTLRTINYRDADKLLR